MFFQRKDREHSSGRTEEPLFVLRDDMKVLMRIFSIVTAIPLIALANFGLPDSIGETLNLKKYFFVIVLTIYSLYHLVNIPRSISEKINFYTDDIEYNRLKLRHLDIKEQYRRHVLSYFTNILQRNTLYQKLSHIVFFFILIPVEIYALAGAYISRFIFCLVRYKRVYKPSYDNLIFISSNKKDHVLIFLTPENKKQISEYMEKYMNTRLDDVQKVFRLLPVKK
jgi:hypothetical protein